MTQYQRITGKVFGGNATATGSDPQIAQFGSALANTFVGTTDPATIQQLPAWGQGWIGAVTPDTQFPPMPEMTGAMKVLSHQICGILQQGVSTWDSGTIYYTDNFVSLNGRLYTSLVDENQGNNPATDTTNWKEFISGGGSGFNLFDTKISDHILSGNEATGWAMQGTYVDGSLYPTFYDKCLEEFKNTSNTATILNNNYTVVGSPTITEDGVASGFSQGNYIYTPTISLAQKNWEIVTPTYRFSSTPASNQALLSSRSIAGFHIYYTTANNITLDIGDGTAWNNGLGTNIQTNFVPPLNTDILFKLKFIYGEGYYFYYSLDGVKFTLLYQGSTTSFIPDMGVNIGTNRNADGAFLTNGYADLKSFKIYVDNQPVYTAIDYISNNPNGHKFYPIASKLKIDEIYSESGIADYYGVDEENERIFLPRNNWFSVVGSNDNVPVVGNGKAMIFTNGTSELSIGPRGSASVQDWYIQQVSAEEGADVGTVGSLLNGVNPNCSRLGLSESASKSGLVANATEIVQPNSNNYLYYCVGNTIVNEAEIDASTVIGLLQSKANITLDNAIPTSAFASALNSAGIRTVVETYQNGTSWYRVYSDNWVEQGGQATGTQITVSLLKPYKDTAYYASWIFLDNTNASNLTFQHQCVKSKTTSSFVISASANTNFTTMWEAKGYMN